MCEFGEGEIMIPIVLLMVDPESQVLFNPLVSSLRLSICARMIGSGDVLGDAQQATDFFHKLACKSRVSVTDDLRGESEAREDLS